MKLETGKRYVTMTPAWKKWFNALPAEERHRIAIAAIARLMEIEEVKFRMDDIDLPDDVPECLYWTASGEDLRDG